MRLADVVKDPRWAEAVAQSPLANHHLSAMCVAVPRNAAPARRVSATVPSPSPCAARFLTLGRARASWSFARRARVPGSARSRRIPSPLTRPTRIHPATSQDVRRVRVPRQSAHVELPLRHPPRARLRMRGSRARARARSRRAPPDSPGHTPDGWTHLWVDAFCHLGDPAGVSSARDISAQLYLHVPALPQYWLGDVLAASKAMTRAWIHQELAYGRLDRDALERFFRICATSYAAQTSAPGYDGDGERPRRAASRWRDSSREANQSGVVRGSRRARSSAVRGGMVGARSRFRGRPRARHRGRHRRRVRAAARSSCST